MLASGQVAGHLPTWRSCRNRLRHDRIGFGREIKQSHQFNGRVARRTGSSRESETKRELSKEEYMGSTILDMFDPCLLTAK
ncbi:hypothetical protein VFPPC_16260 [Pochonia chlamydosporia 170]|uniref:Uncharacterized protein n=1 Tax=Pochonia chlamydosporia 170 TaxID=1380566 RepID=A0A179FHU8_METCM|nr:hypothetical protein VFPPC_16260 [Pochonia chlamydosporia 170]OAQ64811.2 hypothetical protein VFPPC_16260 [Pochonia chlamydosporia 170]